MQNTKNVNIHVYLIRFIFLCVAPLVLLALILASVHVHTLLSIRNQDARDQVRNAITAIDRDLKARIAALQVLAASPLMDAPSRLNEFYKEAQGFHESFTGHVVLADMSSRMLLNTRLPFGSALPKLPVPKGFAAALFVKETGKPAVGDMFLGPIAKVPLIAVVVPVKRHGEMKALLLSIIETQQFQGLLDNLAVSSEYSITLLDSNNDILASRSLPGLNYETVSIPSTRKFEGKSAVSHWNIVFQIPSLVYFKPLFFAGGALAVAIFFVALLSIAGGRLIGRRLVLAVESLVNNPSTVPPEIAITEIENVHSLLDDANAARESAEEELRKNEALYRSLFEVANVGKSITLLTGEMKVNKAFCEMLGYSQDELRNKTWQEVTPPDEIESIQKLIAPVMNNEQNSARFTKRYIHKNGSYIWADVSVAIRRDSDGRPLHFITTVVDISERKRAEEALRESNKRLKTILDSIDVFIYISDMQTHEILFINKYGRRIWGDVKGQLCWKVLQKDQDGPCAFCTNNKLLNKKGSPIGIYQWEFQNTTNGRWYNCRDIAIPWTDGHLVRMELATDITEQKRIREQIIEEKNKLAAFLAAITDGITVQDTNFKILYQNDVQREKQGDHIGEYCYQAYQNREKICPGCLLAKCFADGGIHRHETSTLTDDGVIHLEVSASPIKDAHGNIVSAVETVRDITDRKNMENQLLQAQKMESIGRLAGGVAHDFNNMLSVILGYTDLAKDEIPPDDPLQENLKEIFNAASRSADITRQLLAFARKQTIEPKVLDLNDVVGDLLKMLRRLIGEDIDLAWMPGAELGLVKMDPAQVNQILANLCVNARDAISGVGKVTIETSNVTFDEVYCAEHPGFVPGSYVMLAVSDDGCGMDEETVANIFEPFFSTKAPGKGTGLGLSTVYGIAKQNNGFVNVYSEPGQGTTFKIYFLMYESDGEVDQIKADIQLPVGGSETILFVEDETTILHLGKRMLEKLGYQVLTANTPSEAVKLSIEHSGLIDLLITDIVMPEMNGKELAEMIRTERPEIKVLFMSGYTANVIAHHGILDEGLNFLQKPFSSKELANKIRNALTNNDHG